MFPHGKLAELAARKLALRAQIGGQRIAFQEQAAEMLRPLRTMDRLVDRWRRIAPAAKIAAVPASIAFTKIVLPRLGGAAGLLKWAPVAIRAARLVSGFLK